MPNDEADPAPSTEEIEPGESSEATGGDTPDSTAAETPPTETETDSRTEDPVGGPSAEQADGSAHHPWATDEAYDATNDDPAATDPTAGGEADVAGQATASEAEAAPAQDRAGTETADADPPVAAAETATGADADELGPAPELVSAADTYTFLRPARRRLADFLERTGLEVVDTTWLRPPFCYGAILQEPDTGDLRYHAVEPELSPSEATLRADLEDQLQDELLFRSPDATGDGELAGMTRPASDGNEAREATLRAAVERIVGKYDLAIEEDRLRRVTYYLTRDWIHHGIADPFLQDPRIEEISCDGDEVPLYVYHRDHGSLQTNRSFPTGELRPFVTKLAQRAGRDISIARPLEGAALDDGSRVELTLGEVSQRGPTFTIRRFQEDPLSLPDLIRFGTYDARTLAYLWEAMANGLSVLITGGTASGKTTTLNACSLYLPPKAKIVSIEDTRELQLPQENWIPLLTREGMAEETGIGMQTLLRHALRQRPEVLAVGEVRGAEAGVLFQGMNTGHQCVSTVHSDSVRGLISRLENPPMAVERELISELDLAVIQAQVTIDESRERRCMEIAELYDLDPDTRDLQTRTIFEWDEPTDTIREVASSRHMDALAERGREPYATIERRADVLEYLVDHDITDHQAVADVIQTYSLIPSRIDEQIADGDLDLEALRATRERALSADTQAPDVSDHTAH